MTKFVLKPEDFGNAIPIHVMHVELLQFCDDPSCLSPCTLYSRRSLHASLFRNVFFLSRIHIRSFSCRCGVDYVIINYLFGIVLKTFKTSRVEQRKREKEVNEFETSTEKRERSGFLSLMSFADENGQFIIIFTFC
ncbi:hypothetical protein NECAME_11556, partial [Necator americanus]